MIGWKPLHDFTVGVHPSQINEARAEAEKNGVPTDFDSEGSPIFRTREHRKAYHRMVGAFDKSGGYGDQMKQS